MKCGFLKKVCSIALAGMLSLSAVSALANTDSIEADGSVVNTMVMPVTTSYTGTIDKINVCDGSYVEKGDVIATLKTTKVYAMEDGTVRLFGTVGDSASMVIDHYGAVAYIEPDVKYTISGSTKTAYESEEAKVVHPGEKVYLRGYNTLTHVGTGVVTKVSGTSFTVDVLTGNFESSESVNIYRDAAYTASLRIGRGSTTRSEYTVYEGSGIIVSFQVADGSSVKKGNVLFETIEGEFAGYQTNLTEIKAEESGVINSLSVSLGASVNAGDTICELYPDTYMRVEAKVNEEYLDALSAGNTVQVCFTYFKGGEYTVGGVVEQVSAAGYTDDSSESDECFYKAIIRMDDITGVSYGMNVTVTN